MEIYESCLEFNSDLSCVPESELDNNEQFNVDCIEESQFIYDSNHGTLNNCELYNNSQKRLQNDDLVSSHSQPLLIEECVSDDCEEKTEAFSVDESSQKDSSSDQNKISRSQSSEEYVLESTQSLGLENTTNMEIIIENKTLMVKYFEKSLKKLTKIYNKQSKNPNIDVSFMKDTFETLTDLKMSNIRFLQQVSRSTNCSQSNEYCNYMRLLVEDHIYEEFDQSILKTVTLNCDANINCEQIDPIESLNQILPCDTKLLLIYHKYPLFSQLIKPGIIIRLYPQWNVLNGNIKSIQDNVIGVENEIQYKHFIINAFNIMIEN